MEECQEILKKAKVDFNVKVSDWKDDQLQKIKTKN